MRDLNNMTPQTQAEQKARELAHRLQLLVDNTLGNDAVQELTLLIQKANALDWLNTVDGMDWFSNCDYGEATLSAINQARKEQG